MDGPNLMAQSVPNEDRFGLLENGHSIEEIPVPILSSSVDHRYSLNSRAHLLDSDKESMYSDASFSTSVRTDTESLASSRMPVYSYGATALSRDGDMSKVVLNDIDQFSMDVKCDHCNQQVTTKVKFKPGKRALCFFLFPLCWCFLPLLCCTCSPLQDAHHKCPNCGTTVGVFRRKVLPCT